MRHDNDIDIDHADYDLLREEWTSQDDDPPPCFLCGSWLEETPPDDDHWAPTPVCASCERHDVLEPYFDALQHIEWPDLWRLISCSSIAMMKLESLRAEFTLAKARQVLLEIHPGSELVLLAALTSGDDTLIDLAIRTKRLSCPGDGQATP